MQFVDKDRIGSVLCTYASTINELQYDFFKCGIRFPENFEQPKNSYNAQKCIQSIINGSFG